MRVLAILAASYTLAVLPGAYGLLVEALPIMSGISALPSLLLALTLKCTGRRGKVALICALGLTLGFGWTAIYRTIFIEPAQALDNQTVRLSAQVLQWPQESSRGAGGSVLVRAQTDSVGVDTLLYVDDQGLALRPGDRIETVAHLNYADKTSAGEEITYYTAKGVFLYGRAYGELTVDRPEIPPLSTWPVLLSKALEESILTAFPEGTGARVLAIVMGNRDSLTRPFATSLQRTGLSHTAAVSGMHLSFLAGVLTYFLGKHRRRTALTVIPIVLVFMVIAGCTPSVTRATIMILLLLIAPLLGRERDDATSLGTALLVLLIHNPLAAAHVGLQLSFAAVAGIFLVSEPIQIRLEKLFRIQHGKKWTLKWAAFLIPNYVVACLSATLGALIFTLPLSAIHFSSVSLLSPISNLLSLWAVAVMFCGGLAVGLIGLASMPLAKLLSFPVSLAAVYLDFIIKALSRFTFAAITMDSFYYKAWVCAVSAGVFLALLDRKRRKIILPCILAGISLIAAMAFTAFDFSSAPVSVTMLDVGQGQSVLIRQGNHLTLVDCGGDSYDDPGDIAANYIQDAGRSRLNLLVITHFHDDHANGVLELLERIDVTVIAMPEGDADDALRDQIVTLAQKRGTQCLTIREDTVFSAGGGATLIVYAPLGEDDVNERGLTVLASSGEFDVLLTGDMGDAVEAILLNHTDLPDVEVFAAGHHGSKYATSQALLDAIDPEVVLISVGARNLYGHPAPETLERLEGREIHRTDQEGTITVQISPRGIATNW